MDFPGQNPRCLSQKKKKKNDESAQIHDTCEKNQLICFMQWKNSGKTVFQSFYFFLAGNYIYLSILKKIHFEYF